MCIIAKYEAQAAVAVIGFAGYQLVNLWNQNAPSLAECRGADSDDATIRQQLYDADYLVGGLAITLGVTFAVLTKDATALYVMLVIFGALAMWFHSVLNGESR